VINGSSLVNDQDAGRINDHEWWSPNVYCGGMEAAVLTTKLTSVITASHRGMSISKDSILYL
jgi:hypothetical protein